MIADGGNSTAKGLLCVFKEMEGLGVDRVLGWPGVAFPPFAMRLRRMGPPGFGGRMSTMRGSSPFAALRVRMTMRNDWSRVSFPPLAMKPPRMGHPRVGGGLKESKSRFLRCATEWKYKSATEWKYKSATEWKYKSATEWKYKSAAEWKCKRATEWKYKSAAEWKCKRATEWKCEGVAEWKCRKTAEWDRVDTFAAVGSLIR